MPDKTKITFNELILLLTAFAAGAVDIISFATLGGVFASAMRPRSATVVGGKWARPGNL